MENDSSSWDQAIAEGSVSVDAFFDELDARIKKRFDEHPKERNNPDRVNE